MPNAQQLGRYQLLDRIAFGGMAEIFRAKTFDVEGRVHLVAVKRVLNHLTADEEFLKMLVDEAKITATLSHDNIARVYEFAHSGDEYFIAMEYVDGKDVRALLERHRAKSTPIPPEHVAWIGMEVAHALQAAHTQRDGANKAMHIVHRDVSPSNVLCSYNGEIKLCDFGIAKATLTRTQTKTGVIKGKVKYMSPEQAMGRKLDHRSDLFSLGTVMYEMLTLEPPFQAATEVELIFAVRDARRRSARSVSASVPEELDQLLDKAMSRSRSQRFQSGEELATALRVFLDRYKPGYRRSHFGRFMRGIFATEIERELRLLEEYVIDSADPTRVGENLIADALPADAPYTKFNAQATSTHGDPADLPPLPDLHGQPTRILISDSARSMGGTGLHDRDTRMLDISELPPPEATTGPRRRADTGDAVSPEEDRGGSEHGGDGGDDEDEPTHNRDEGLPPLNELATRILRAPAPGPPERPPLHELQTHILRLPDRPPPLPPPRSPLVVTAPPEPVESSETTTVPLRDDDLDPV